MTTPTTTKTGHHSLDFPNILGHSYASNNPTIAPLPTIFLFTLPSSRREEILEQIRQGDGTPWPDNILKSALGAVPWLRSFEPTINDILQVAAGTCIVITNELLQEGKCIISHNLHIQDAMINSVVQEFAIVKITDAYKLACSEKRRTSWFPDTLSLEHQFIPTKDPEPETRTESEFKPPLVDLPVLVTVTLTPEQQTYLVALLSCESAEPEFLHVPNTNDELDDIDHLMAYFLEKAWFPGDFVVIDSRTLSSTPTPIPTSSEPVPYAEFDPPHPSFLLGTELLMWHRASDGQQVGMDQVGYAVGRRTMEHSEEYQEWDVNVFRAMGLRSWIGWEDGEEVEGIDRYYWNCWSRSDGRVDSEVRAEATVKY